MREAGEAQEGLVLEARLGAASLWSLGQRNLIISLKNVGDLPFEPGWVCLDPLASVLRGIGENQMTGPQPSVFIRNSNNEFVELSKEGIAEFNIMYGMAGSGGAGHLPPGWAWGEEVSIWRRFRLSEPGRYTVLVAGNVGRLRLVAKPVVLDIGNQPPSAPAGQQARGNIHQEAGHAAGEGKGPDKEWSELVMQANRPLRGFELRAEPSHVAEKSDHLIISLCWAGPVVEEGDHRETTRATRLANYRLFVRDTRGNNVPLTEWGRTVFADKQPFYSYAVARPGQAWGLVCWLSELFSVKRGHDYKVLVVLQGIDAKKDPWVAGPVSVHVPELEVAGVTRPPYGSARIWKKLTAMAATPRNDLLLNSKLGVYGSSVGLSIQLKRPEQKVESKPPATGGRQAVPNPKDDPNGSHWYWADQLCLVCDSRGTPVMPDENGRRHAGHGGGFSYPANSPEDGQEYQSISASYPLQPGRHYTVISAISLAEPKKLILPPGLAPGVVVSKPVEFTMPEGDFSPTPGGIFIGHDDRETPKPKPKPRPAPNPESVVVPPPSTFDQQWQQASRFAGKPFDGLLLDASAGRPAELKVTLRNRGGKEILVKKWKGESDYEVLVRDLTGKPVGLTEKGKRFFAGGKLLDFRELKPGEAIEATLQLGSIFLVKAPGEYDVLVSLPVLGDVDAVLTAAPVKVRFP